MYIAIHDVKDARGVAWPAIVADSEDNLALSNSHLSDARANRGRKRRAVLLA